MEPASDPGTTAISTVAVQSGSTRIVIALLKYNDWLELKVLEVSPCLTELGQSLQEAIQMKTNHEQVIAKIQSKTSPVEELYRRAGEALDEKCTPQVYSAMADSLSAAWDNIGSHLQARDNLLHLNVQYFRGAEEFEARCERVEERLAAELPVELEELRSAGAGLAALHREMLTALSAALHHGERLLHTLTDLAQQGTLDSRPSQIKAQAHLAKVQVEGWLEGLHGRRRLLSAQVEERSRQLSQCLALALVTADLTLLRRRIEQRREALSSDHLGDSTSSATLLLQEHRKLFPEAREMQEQAVKIVKGTEDVAQEGHFAGPEAIAQAYTLLESTSEYIHQLEAREALLTQVVDFFSLAEPALSKLEELELKLASGADQQSSLTEAVDSLSAQPLHLGYEILQQVPAAQGVKRMVEHIENKKISLNVQCTSLREESIRATNIYNNFTDKFNQMNGFATSMEAWLRGMSELGTTTSQVKEFLQAHKNNATDLQMKRTEVQGLISSVGGSGGSEVGGRRQEELRATGEGVRRQFCRLGEQLEARIQLASVYLRLLQAWAELGLDMDAIQAIIVTPHGDQAHAEQLWVSCRQRHAQLNNTAHNFLLDIKAGGLEPALVPDSPIEQVEQILREAELRKRSLDTAWTKWLEDKAAVVRNQASWDRLMAEANKTVDWVSKLDGQLYPVLKRDATSARQLASHVDHKINTVLPEISRAQQEISLRLQTAQALINSGDVKGGEGIPVRLKELSIRLQTIASDYQSLLQHLLVFFNSLSKVENKIEAVQKDQMNHKVASCFPEAERRQSEFDTTRHTIDEMLSSSITDSVNIISRIRTQEEKSESDSLVVERAVEGLRYDWQRVSNERERVLERDLHQCRFDSDLAQINVSVEQLSTRLHEGKGHHGHHLPSALSAQSAFKEFQHTISLVDEKIVSFIESGEDLLVGAIGDHVERELAALQRRWQQLKQQVLETRTVIDITVKYYMLIEEAQNWFQEGNMLLERIIQRASEVTQAGEAQELLEQINTFLKPGEESQQRRIDQISSYSEQLSVSGPLPHLFQVKTENNEIINSFSQVSARLQSMVKKLNEPSAQSMELDQSSNVITVDNKSPHFNSSTTVTSHYSSSTIIQEIQVHEQMAVPLEAELRKSPTPPPKKVKKDTEETLKLDPPYFTMPLKNINIEEGIKVKMECRVRGDPTPEITWEKDGLSIENNLDYVTSYDQGVCSLTIEEAFTEDSARFTCRASNAAGSAETSATLNVKESEREEVPYPPIVVESVKNGEGEEGGRLELRCRFAGLPLPTAVWSLAGRSLDTDSTFSTVFNNGEATLTKPTIGPSDSGLYTCTATNPLGTVSTSASFTVHRRKEKSEAPVFKQELEDVMARAGQKIKLECQVMGTPEPEVTWTFNGKPLPSTHKVVREAGRWTLLVEEAYPKDGGEYCVTATNSAGRALSTAKVSVKGRPPPEEEHQTLEDMTTEPSKPQVHAHLRHTTVLEGKPLSLDCVIVGHPEPEVIWYHKGRPVKESRDIKLLFQGDRCSLVISEAFLEDAGQYKVVAINSAGQANSSCSVTVHPVDSSTEGARREAGGVIESEVVEETKPYFVRLLADVQAELGATISLECEVGGRPPPTVSWLHNNHQLVQSNRVHMSQEADGVCRLRLSGVAADDRGVYTARATNQQGEAKCFSNLSVKGSPSAPPAPHPAPQEPPNFSQLFSDRTVAEGAPSKFECIVSGKPTPKVRWLYNNEPVSGKNFLVSTSGNRQVLLIPSVSKSLAGKVSCIAENEAGKCTCEASLTVTDSMTTLIPSLENMSSLQENSFFEMKKSVFSHSSTTSEFSSSTSQPHVEVKSFTSQSEVAAQKIGEQPVSKFESHKTAEYSNLDGVESSHASEEVSSTGSGLKAVTAPVPSTIIPIKVIKPQRKSQPPRFVSPLQGCIVDQGTDVTLEAIIEGFPTPSVCWSKNGAPLPQESETTWKLNRAVLRLASVTTALAGRYSLTASNEAGTAVSTADVVVKKSSFPPVMGRRLQASTALLGQRVALEIEVTGTPSPSVTWFKDGLPTTSSNLHHRLLSQGNCHSLIIDNAELSHSGQYSVIATNSAGEARSSADLLVIEPSTNETQSFSDEQVLQTTKECSRTGESILKPMLSTFTNPGKEGVSISESFTSEKHVSMKVERSGGFFESSLLPPPEISKPVEKVVRFEESPVFAENGTINDENEHIDTSSTSKKSALDFFKTIIKENEEESKKAPKEVEVPFTSSWSPPVSSASKEWKSSFKSFKSESVEKHDRPSSPLFHIEPGPAPEMGYIPKVISPPPKDDMLDRVRKLQESHRNLSESEIPTGGVKIYPIPVKKEKPLPPVEYVDRVIYPERKKSIQMDYSHKKEVVEEVIVPKHVELPNVEPQHMTTQVDHSINNVREQMFQQEITPGCAVMRPSADISIRPLSPRPSAEGVSMEKLWSSVHKETSSQQSFHSHSTSQSSFQTVEGQKIPTPVPTVQKPWTPLQTEPLKLPPVQSVSPTPSKDALFMEKQWGHKQTESQFKTVWPPTCTETEEKVHTDSQVNYNIQNQKTVFKSPEVTQPTIYYIAEAHATHRANPVCSQLNKSFSSHTSSETIIKDSSYTEDRNILPSQAKKIWSQGPPVSFETRGFMKKESKLAKRSNSLNELTVDDLKIEPGPPPEIGYATPPPRERRQSYVETIEQDLAKDLEKEPTRHLVGAVRTIPPPPKKETSVGPSPKVSMISSSSEKLTKSFCRSSSFNDDFKPFPELEPFPFKVEPLKQNDFKYCTIPRPSKFIKKPYSESDYESDFDGKIKSRWTPWDSDVEEPTYRKVKPPNPLPKRPHSVEPEPLPPSKFDKGPVISYYKTSFTSEKPLKHLEFEIKTKAIKNEINDSLKPGSPPEFVTGKKQDGKPESPKNKKKSQIYESGYMADTDEPRKFGKQTKITSIHQTSSWQSEKVKSEPAKSEKIILSPKTEKLEPFPYQVEAKKPVVNKTFVAHPSPSKFVKGEFRESDYESDYEGKIKAMWRPTSAEPKDPTFRPVRPLLSETKSQSTHYTQSSSSFSNDFNSLTRMEPLVIKPEPVHLKPGSPPRMDFAPPPQAVETSSSLSFAESTESSRRVVSMQQTTRLINFDQTSRRSQTLPHKSVPKGEAKWASATDSESESTMKELSGLEHSAEQMRLHRVQQMRSRFGESTSHGLINLQPEQPPTFEYAPPKIPSVASTIANKHMSEMTSSFKSKAHQLSNNIISDVKKKEVPKQDQAVTKDSPTCYREETRHSEHGSKHIDPDSGLIYFKYDFGYEFGVVAPGEGSRVKGKPEDKEGSVNIPVIHERSDSVGRVGWTSESEVSEAEERRVRPRVTFPASPSTSPSIPSLSPYAHHTPDSAVHGSSWSDKGQPSSMVLNPGLHDDVPKKAPHFITPLRDIAVVSGQTGRFECIVQAEPLPNVLWTKDGRIIEPSLNHEVMLRNGVCRLTIHHVFSDDQGIYKCTATNNLGTADTTANLTVSGEARTYII